MYRTAKGVCSQSWITHIQAAIKNARCPLKALHLLFIRLNNRHIIIMCPVCVVLLSTWPLSWSRFNIINVYLLEGKSDLNANVPKPRTFPKLYAPSLILCSVIKSRFAEKLLSRSRREKKKTQTSAPPHLNIIFYVWLDVFPLFFFVF